MRFFAGSLVTLGGAAYASSGTYPMETALGEGPGINDAIFGMIIAIIGMIVYSLSSNNFKPVNKQIWSQAREAEKDPFCMIELNESELGFTSSVIFWLT